MTLEKSLTQFKALRDQYEEQIRSLDHLERAVRIKHLWPEAFAVGTCTASIKCKSLCIPRWTDAGELWEPWRYTLVLKRGDGERRNWLLADLDMGVWVPFWTLDEAPLMVSKCLTCGTIYKAVPGPQSVSSGYCPTCAYAARESFLAGD
jgi:hypothetical protein